MPGPSPRGPERAAEPFLEVDDRLVADQGPGAPEVGLRVADVAGASGAELGRQAGAQRLVDRGDEVEQADPPAGPDVDRLAVQFPGEIERPEVGRDDVG